MVSNGIAFRQFVRSQSWFPLGISWRTAGLLYVFFTLSWSKCPFSRQMVLYDIILITVRNLLQFSALEMWNAKCFRQMLNYNRKVNVGDDTLLIWNCCNCNRVNKQGRAAGVLENFEEGQKYSEHALRKLVRNRRPEIMPSINSFFADPQKN